MKRSSVVGNNISMQRRKKGYSQEKLALQCGLSQGYINQLENGKRSYTQKSLEVIAEALSIPVIELFRDGAETVSGGRGRRPIHKLKKSVYKKELSELLKGLPDHIIDHYITLIKLEKEILKSEER